MWQSLIGYSRKNNDSGTATCKIVASLASRASWRLSVLRTLAACLSASHRNGRRIENTHRKSCIQALSSRLRFECSAPLEELFQKLSVNLRFHYPSICRVLAAFRNSDAVPRDGEAPQNQLRPMKLLPHDYWSVETELVQLNSSDRRLKQQYSNSTLTSSWVFAAQCHSKGGAAMLDVSSTTAITLHICIISFFHRNAPLFTHKGTTFPTNGHSRLPNQRVCWWFHLPLAYIRSSSLRLSHRS